MVEPKLFVINEDLKFEIGALPILKAAKLDKKVIALALPIISGLENISLNNLDKEINLKDIMNGITESLSNLDDEEYITFVMDLLSCVKHIFGKDNKNNDLKVPIKKEHLDELFSGKLMAMYSLLFEVMKHNKFSPFEVVAGGLSQLQIGL